MTSEVRSAAAHWRRATRYRSQRNERATCIFTRPAVSQTPLCRDDTPQPAQFRFTRIFPVASGAASRPPAAALHTAGAAQSRRRRKTWRAHGGSSPQDQCPRHLRDLDSRATMATALAFAALALTPAAALTAPPKHPSVSALSALAVLVVFCTAAALLVYAILVAEVGAGRAATVNYVAPIVAVGLGVAVLGEPVELGTVAGLVLILGGSWLSTDGRLPVRVELILSRHGRRRKREPRASGPRVATLRSWSTRAEAQPVKLLSVPIDGEEIGDGGFAPQRTEWCEFVGSWGSDDTTTGAAGAGGGGGSQVAGGVSPRFRRRAL